MIPEVIALMLLFSAPPLLHSQELALAVAAASYLGAWLLFWRAPGDLLVAVSIALVDLMIEGVLVGFGLFQYANSSYLPLPIWLPFLWGGLGLGLRRLFAMFDRLPERRD